MRGAPCTVIDQAPGLTSTSALTNVGPQVKHVNDPVVVPRTGCCTTGMYAHARGGWSSTGLTSASALNNAELRVAHTTYPAASLINCGEW